MNITKEKLKKILYTNIPLTQAMAVDVIQADLFCTILSAPLEPNINHQGTIFGGSANTLAILSAWSLLYLRLKNNYPQCHIVIQKNTMKYEQPMPGEIISKCNFDDLILWQRFIRTLERYGRSRIKLNAVVLNKNQRCAVFNGDFVAWC